MQHVSARFEIRYVQLLNEYGESAHPLPSFTEDPEILRTLYRLMMRTRLFDKRAIALQRTGKLGTYAPAYGQEAIATAIGHALKPEDVFIPYYRDYAAQLQRGVSMSDLFSYWNGDERGNFFSTPSEDLPISVPIASQCLHATGIAFAFKYRQQARVALVSIGDGGTSEGDFYEAMNLAGVWNLPLVFVITNNQWAISVPLNKQTATQTLAQKAIAAGFQGIQVDGNDIIATRHVIGEAIENARVGLGPTLIEAITYRLSDHTTADDAKRYQPQNDVELAREKEPMQRFRYYLEQRKIWNETLEQEWIATLTHEIQEAVEIYQTRPRQSISSAFDYHYSTLPDYLVEQRATALEEAQNA